MDSTLKKQVEALLFSSGKAMEEEQLAVITGEKKKAVKAALKALAKEYESRDTALKLFNEGATWKLLVHDEYIPLVRRIVADTELSKATMETLAVIAYHQPNVLQSKVVELRGGNAYEHIKELEELGFITKTKQGRSFSLKLTEKFFDYFDVEGEKTIRQVFKEVAVPEAKERQKRLGDLEVIDEPPQEKRTKSAIGLEVIDAEEEEKQPEPEEIKTPPTAKIERDPEEEKDFLGKIEAQIDAITKRNDERAEDTSFKPVAPPEETTSPTEEAAAGESNVTETSEESEKE